MKTVTRSFFVVFILILTNHAHGQVRGLAGVIDSVVVKAKRTALNARVVKWDSVQPAMHQAAAGAKSVRDLKQSLEILLSSLNDKHGEFYDPATLTRIAAYPDHRDKTIADQERLNGDQGATFDYRMLQNDISYIRLVAAPVGTDVQKAAEAIRQAVDSLSKRDSPFWIVDLRYAVGGDMNALFAGMGPLLGEGLIATSVDGKKKIRNLFAVYNGKFYDNQVLVADFPSSVKVMHDVKIAVLTSKYTSGASEILALGLKGRKNTKVIGEATAGQITGTGEIKITNDLVMSISETRFDDRKGKSYTHNLIPDTLIEFIPNAGFDQDKAIAEATLWLTTVPVSETATAKVTLK